VNRRCTCAFERPASDADGFKPWAHVISAVDTRLLQELLCQGARPGLIGSDVTRTQELRHRLNVAAVLQLGRLRHRRAPRAQRRVGAVVEAHACVVLCLERRDGTLAMRVGAERIEGLGDAQARCQCGRAGLGDLIERRLSRSNAAFQQGTCLSVMQASAQCTGMPIFECDSAGMLRGKLC
jgi:hypothetical protein